MVVVALASGARRSALALAMLNQMRKRGLQLLEAPIRSFDPSTPTARERLEAALGEPFTRRLLRVLLPAAEERLSGGSESSETDPRR